MSTDLLRNVTIGVYTALAGLVLPTAAHAQFTATPFSDPATGERYHIEASGAFWNPPPDIVIASESLGVAGTQINAVTDLGIQQQRIKEFRVVLRPGKKHKFRLNYIPMGYQASSTLRRDIVFNGIKYSVNLPVTTELSWNTWHLGYEYDFLYRDRWYAGVVVQAKVTDIQANLKAVVGTEFARARAPIPTIGGIGRVYVVPNISITSELSMFPVPEGVNDQYRAHYVDFDLYGTVNFNDYVGAQLGWRSLDMRYVFESDRGDFKAKGLYFGGVVRY